MISRLPTLSAKDGFSYRTGAETTQGFEKFSEFLSERQEALKGEILKGDIRKWDFALKLALENGISLCNLLGLGFRRAHFSRIFILEKSLSKCKHAFRPKDVTMDAHMLSLSMSA